MCSFQLQGYLSVNTDRLILLCLPKEVSKKGYPKLRRLLHLSIFVSGSLPKFSHYVRSVSAFLSQKLGPIETTTLREI